MTATELGRLLRPHKPLCRHTIANWTRKGAIPRDCYEFRGAFAWYSVPRLIAAGVLLPEVTNAAG